jgi:hypothetical protein
MVDYKGLVENLSASDLQSLGGSPSRGDRSRSHARLPGCGGRSPGFVFSRRETGLRASLRQIRASDGMRRSSWSAMTVSRRSRPMQPTGATTPNSDMCARMVLDSWVRCRFGISRTRDQLPRPIVRRVARLDADHAMWQLLEDHQHATSAEGPAHDYLSRRIDPVHLKHRLRDAQSHRRNRFHRGDPFRLILR